MRQNSIYVQTRLRPFFCADSDMLSYRGSPSDDRSLWLRIVIDQSTRDECVCCRVACLPLTGQHSQWVQSMDGWMDGCLLSCILLPCKLTFKRRINSVKQCSHIRLTAVSVCMQFLNLNPAWTPAQKNDWLLIFHPQNLLETPKKLRHEQLALKHLLCKHYPMERDSQASSYSTFSGEWRLVLTKVDLTASLLSRIYLFNFRKNT